LRWKNEEGVFVPPSEFIVIAEEVGLIHEIDKWVLRTACRMAAQWPQVPRIAVNISAKAISQSGIGAIVRSILVETGIAPSRLELEVTETALINDLNRALHNLRQIKALGIAIAMDDFGIGYSSLSLLNAFPFDRIKIDRSFIELAGSNARADAIFQTIIGLGTALQVPVLAEGVETEEQLSFASKAGCEEVQGFLFGKPISMGDLTAFFSRNDSLVGYNAIKDWQLSASKKALTG
jgi:diguanylate cyclase